MNNDYINSNYPPINNYMVKPQNLRQDVKVPEQYIETNFYININKMAHIHMSFPDSQVERDKVFYGKIYEIARDHIVIEDQINRKWYLLPLMYLNYAEFDEKPVTLKEVL